MGETVRNIRQSINRGDTSQEWVVSCGHVPYLAVRGIEAVGWVVPGEGYRFVWTQPEWSLLYVTVAGSGEALVENAWRRCDTGCAYVAPARQVIGYRKRDGVDWQAVWVVVRDPSLIAVERASIVAAEHGQLLAAVQGLHNEDRGRADASVLASYTELVLAYTRRIVLGAPAGAGSLRPVWELVLSDLGRPWTVAELARQASVSEATLRRLCRAEIGRSPMAHVTHLRMRQATALLVSAEISIATIAAAVGYTDPLAFSTAFSRLIGVAPSHFRKRSGQR